MRILTARFVVPVTTPVIERGALLLRDGHIRALGSLETIAGTAPTGTPIEDLGDAALLPGFVNPHTHLELTAYHGVLPRAPLWEWFNTLLPSRLTPGAADRELASLRRGAQMSLDAGVTLIGDISRCGITASALGESPIRRICFVELISGASAPPSNIAELESMSADTEQSHGGDRCVIGVTPHAPYTVTPTDLRASVQLATRRRCPLTMHLLETIEERDWLHGRPGFLATFLRDRGLTCADHQPDSPSALLKAAGFDEFPALFAHVNYDDAETTSLIAKAGSSVVYCPRAHAWFGHEGHPWRALLQAGVNVCVGTDSLASNDSLSILDELRFLAMRHPDVNAGELLSMGTSRSAHALGVAPFAGRLEPGAWADVCAIPCVAKSTNQVVDEIIRGAAQPARTWVAGADVSMPDGL
ncbi:MAG TPA: amidohydrolase family protein [Phycisphaerae bacterium]|nr:amidohydrolase family protein [Phycisphaerae bacterium]HRW54531.1 amidohydrolase family protein [Phycisphaerae bacterium]